VGSGRPPLKQLGGGRPPRDTHGSNIQRWRARTASRHCSLEPKPRSSRSRRGYDRSLHAKTIDTQLRVDIKNACENLRSVLDYIAKDIRERYCPSASPGVRFYFPILPDKPTFDRKLDEWFPGLRQAAPAVVAALESRQPFQAKQEWLGHFNQVNNENKHGDLVEQTRVENLETRVTGRGGQVSWGPGVTFGQGVSIMGVPIDPRTQLPVPDPSVKVERITWVDFHFAGIEVSALGLLRKSLAGIQSIEATIRPLL